MLPGGGFPGAGLTAEMSCSPGCFLTAGKALAAKPDQRAWEITTGMMLPVPRQGPAPALGRAGWLGERLAA